MKFVHFSFADHICVVVKKILYMCAHVSTQKYYPDLKPKYTISGFGYCLLYMPSYVLTGLYYEKHRSLATGVCTAGSSLGGIVYPIFVQYLINEYGWRGSVLILSGVNMNTIWLAGLLRPAPLQLGMTATEEMEIEREEEPFNVNGKDGVYLSIKQKENGADVCFHGEDIVPSNNDTEKSNMIRRKSSVKSKRAFVIDFFRVMKNIPFIIYFINNLFWNFGGVLTLILEPEYFTSINFTPDEASQLMSCSGIGSFIGCAVGGAVGNLPFINRMAMYFIVNLAIGLEGFLILQPFAHSFLVLAIIIGTWDFLYGLLLGLLVVVTADLVGAESLGDAMGFLMLASGIGCVAGPPIGG